jgi:OmcA/MtrC family decaheme c-type cytochrome
MKLRLITSSLLALVGATLIGCGGGGGSDGVTTSSSSSSGPTPPVATTGPTDTTTLSPAAIANLSIAGSVQGVTINSPPVVTFQLVNSDNSTALTGIEKWTVKRNDVKAGAVASPAASGTTDKVATYPNFAFALAKYVPGSNGSPGKWVSYMVSSPVFDASGNVTGYTPSAPGTENNGTMEYLGNGQYKYTFRRDIKEVANQVAASTDSTTSLKADLGDLKYDPNAIHRLVIQVSGVARGSASSLTSSSSAYCNTSDGLCPGGFAGTPYEIIRTPIDIVFDWIPATGRVVKVGDTDVEQREVVNVAACASCHNKFTFHGGNALKGWGGGRQETRMCVVCHTDQRKFGSAGTAASQYNADGFSFNLTANASTKTINGLDSSDRHSNFDFPVFIHKIHMGEELTRAGYNSGVKFNEVKYPQLITNCAKCHSGDTTKPDGSANIITKLDGTVVQMATTQGNNWNTKPNRLACGACHDGINFNTGLGTTLAGTTGGHGAGGVGGAQADDSKCSTCHTPDAIKKVHVAVTPQDRNSSLFKDCANFNAAGTCNGNTNAAWLASNPNNLPAGAIKVTYDIKSVSRNASKQPVMVFRFLQNGVRKDFNANTATEMWDNFMGSPSAYFVFSVPQDGIAAPADFNASASGYVRSIWKGTATGTGAGTLSVPDADGYYTLTLTGVTIPDGAVMLTGGLGYTYSPATTMPLTQTNLNDYPAIAATADGTGGSVTLTTGMPNKTGGLIVVAPDVQVVASAGVAAGGTGGAYTGRRQIVDDVRCNNCHQELGAFNASQFHAGQRNDGRTCSWCHNPNRTSSGWSADSTNFIHGIHGGLKRTNKFTWHAASTTDGFWTIGYPGVLKNCEACHIPGSYDFSNAASKTAAGLSGGTDNRLFRYSATGTFKSKTTILSAFTTPTQAQIDAADLTVFAYSPFVSQDVSYGTGFSFSAGTGVTTAAGATNLLETPTATVCFACHDDSTTVKASMGKTAKQHMLDNGGQIYAARGATPVQTETCLTSCHGPSSAANIKAVHSK